MSDPREWSQAVPAEPRPEEETRPAAATGEVAGMLGAAAATRSGQDTRKRGWFWHWNSIVTQYAPLLGLKGVGLLNSYTVWTDRREESPHRGYAFPSQQREADFYGEDRAELITINKILVALDLIEIRKEMVLRADEQGRRWRVPHNFYRVKDHGDGFTLTLNDVRRVVALAERDRAVYRYLRHIFSARFAPIDPQNVWYQILPAIQQDENWQRLAERVALEEDRASARTRAGHASRKTGRTTPALVATQAAPSPSNDTDGVGISGGVRTSVAATNKGSPSDVGTSNTGFGAPQPTDVAPVNEGKGTDVAPANTTYHEDLSTTTTIGVSDGSGGFRNPDVGAAASGDPPAAVPAGESQAVTGAHRGTGPGERDAPGAGPERVAAVQAFEDANGRASTPAERRLLTELADRFDPVARATGLPERPGGWSWVEAAIYEAVEAGSAFVAPRRVREILSRWERQGFPGTGPNKGVTAKRLAAIQLAEAPDLPLPHGFGSVRTWAFTVELLGSVIDRQRLVTLVHGSAIVGYQDGEVTLAVPDAAQAAQLSGEYHALVTRKLSEAMRRPVRLAVLTLAEEQPEPTLTPVEEALSDAPVVAPAFLVEECGLPSPQVWAAILDELAAGGQVSRPNLEAWLRPSQLVGRGPGGALVIGAPNGLARKRLSQRLLPPLRAAAQAVIGAAVPVDVVLMGEWLADRDDAVPGSSAGPQIA